MPEFTSFYIYETGKLFNDPSTAAAASGDGTAASVAGAPS